MPSRRKRVNGQDIISKIGQKLDNFDFILYRFLFSVLHAANRDLHARNHRGYDGILDEDEGSVGRRAEDARDHVQI